MLLLIATPELIELGGGKWRLGGLVPPILMVEWTLRYGLSFTFGVIFYTC